MQQEEQARRDFEHASEIEPDSCEIRRSLADLLHKMGHVREAIEHYQDLCQRRPSDQRALLALAQCWQEESHPNEARELVDQLLLSRPDSVSGLVERGRLALRAGEPEAAERWLRRAVVLSPDHADANFVLRLALQAQQKEDTVLDRHIDQNDLRQAELKTLLHETEHKPALVTDVARWMMRTGLDNEVLGWLYSALKEDSAYAPAHQGLAEFFSERGQTRRAQWHARQAGIELNRDGRPDFVALISQQHETVVAYLNQGDGAFQQATIFTAPHPSYGCSGIEVVDLDNDSDLDVLLSNGDILDPPYVFKPYHGVQWLENEGAFPYKRHQLAAMYGVSRAVAADFDGDGNQDVAAVTFLPAMQFPEREQLRLPSVVLLKQSPKKQFAMHILETGKCDHFSCAAGDWDDDGRVDLVVTNFSWSGSQPMGDAALLWRNVGNQ